MNKLIKLLIIVLSLSIILIIPQAQAAACTNTSITARCAATSDIKINTGVTGLVISLTDAAGAGAVTLNKTGLIFDCNGATLKGGNLTNSIGFLFGKFNTATLKNCTIKNYYRAITHDAASSSVRNRMIDIRVNNSIDAAVYLIRDLYNITRFTGYNNTDNIRINGAAADNVIIRNSTFRLTFKSTAGDDGIHCNGGQDGLQVYDSTFSGLSDKQAIYLSNCNTVKIWRNTFRNGRVSIESDSSGTLRVSIINNTWNNITSSTGATLYSPIHLQNANRINISGNTYTRYLDNFCSLCNNTQWYNNIFTNGISNYSIINNGINNSVIENTLSQTIVRTATGTFVYLVYPTTKYFNLSNNVITVKNLVSPHTTLLNKTCYDATGLESCVVLTGVSSFALTIKSGIIYLVQQSPFTLDGDYYAEIVLGSFAGSWNLVVIGFAFLILALVIGVVLVVVLSIRSGNSDVLQESYGTIISLPIVALVIVFLGILVLLFLAKGIG
jgi:hypothetical protein